jgi:hypothetical protein
VVAFVPAAQAAGTVGYDISHPQCNAAFPTGAAFGIVGVNGGLPYSANPCLGAGDGPSELAWAGMNAGLYANTADPGPALSSHWPNGDAVNAYVSLGWAQAGATQTPVANQWWLDVESANSWTSTPSLNVQALQGEADYLSSVGAAQVGFYATAGDWQTITGSTTAFANSPSWLPGASSLADAESRCGGAGITGGGVALTQFVSGGFDNDYRCVAQPALQFASGSQTLQAGNPSAPISIRLGQAAGSDLSVTIGSSASSGSFSTSPSGPWTSTITLPVAAGAASTAGFYYQDTKAATPTLTATAAGYSSAAQTETVVAAALAALSITPTSLQTKLGSSSTLQAAGADAYGNPVAVNASWSVTPNLGTFSPTSGSRTTFTSTTVGTGTITATASGHTATAAVSVVRRHH